MNVLVYIFMLALPFFVRTGVQEENECPVKLVEHILIIVCVDGESEFELGPNVSFVRSGTVCVFKRDEVYDIRKCSNGVWVTKYEHYSSVQKRKVKRWTGDISYGPLDTYPILIEDPDNCLAFRGSYSDRTPPVLKCPASITLPADPIQTHKTGVYWKPPTATDDEDGWRPVKLRGKNNNYTTFVEGATSVTYETFDRSSNYAACSFTIIVKVYRCPPPTPITDGYYICHPSTDFVQGTRCRFGCYDGFELDPPHVTSKTCLTTEKWDKAQPICKPFQCPPLPFVDGATFQCTNDRYFRSICTYRCKTGYAMPPGVSATLVCAGNKQWRGYGRPVCVDIIRPEFVTCPSIAIVGTDDAVATATISWESPRVDDNSGGKIDIRQTRGNALGSKLTAGTYTIEYNAQDEAGNNALPCRFKVVVRDVRCPKLYTTPYTNFHCAHGYRSGVLCNITCDPGKEMDGENFVICQKSIKGLYGEWLWTRGQTRCNRTHNCLPIPAPRNGAVACDTWMGGQFCQMQCRNGTFIHSNCGWKNVHVCSRQGNWFPTPARGPCAKPRNRAEISLAVSVYCHFDGDCSNETTRIQIQENFISALNNSAYSRATCLHQADKCFAKHVQVRCGASDRQKRSAGTDSIATPPDSLVTNATATGTDSIATTPDSLVTNATATNTTTLNNDLHVSLHVSLNTSRSSSMEDTIVRYTYMFRHLNASLTSKIIRLPGSDIALELITMETSGLTRTCPKGSVSSNQSFTCIDCPEGTYYSEDQSICLECPKGTYQDLTGQLTCLDCPNTTTTRTTGSTNQAECEAACEPGYRSEHGVVPCSFCEVGTYNTGYGNQACTRCPGSTSTLTEGSNNISECKEFDIVFTPGEPTDVHLALNEPLSLKDVFVTFWIQSLNVTSSDFTFRLHDINDVPIVSLLQTAQHLELQFVGLQYPILEPATPDTRWHFVEVILQECTLTVKVDGGNVTSQCVACDGVQTFSVAISTEINFEGRLSQLNLWSHQQYQTISSQRTCFHGDTGVVLSWQDFNDAQMDGAYMDLDSLCDDFDNCASSPCINGICSDAVHGFTCECVEGYTGSTCSDNIDDCQANICMNGGSCVDGVTGYTCACLSNYTGEYCEIEMVHGAWGEWSNYTECRATCGPNTKQRYRLCDSPTPDNGGSNCTGNSTEVSDCNLEPCPTCPNLVDPDHGSLSCDTDADNHTCTISCEPGYDFDIQPMDSYFCGPETFYHWNFESPDNPLRRFPQCTKMHTPSHLTITYNAKYKDWTCAQGNDVFIRDKLDTVVSELQCVQESTCTVSGRTDICIQGDRKKRSTGVSSFAVTLETRPENIDDSGTLFGLQYAIETLQAAVEAGNMTVHYNGQTYVIDIHTTVGGVVTCAAGFVKVYHYCVACGKGSYLNKDYCELCDLGTYQDEEGHATCKSCPEGKSTLGLGSVNNTDCTVDIPLGSNDNTMVLGIIGGFLMGGVVICVAVIIYYFRQKKTKKVHVVNNEKEQEAVFSLPSKDQIIQSAESDPDIVHLSRVDSGLSMSWLYDDDEWTE